MEELLEEFKEWIKDNFEHRNPDDTAGFEYRDLFKKFWEDKADEFWKYEIGKEVGCMKYHEEIYEPMDQDDIDWDME